MIDEQSQSSPLRLPLFRAVWITSIFSNFGALIQAVGASWMMTSLGASAEKIALVQASTSLPILLLGLWAGAIADNFDRRLVMLAAQLVMLAISAGLATATWLGVVTPWLLLIATFLIGCGAAVNGPAWQASVGDLVPRASLPAAVALNSMGFNIARSFGPAIGGAIVAAAGVAAAFLANTFSYLGLIIVLVRWRPVLPARTLPRERLGTAMLAGARYVWLSPHLRVVLARAALFGVGASAIPALMPLVARDLPSGGPLTYGLLLGGFGVGAVIGAFASGRLRDRTTIENTVRIASGALAGSALVVANAVWLPLTLLALIPAGAGWVVALSTFNVSVQLGSPRWVVARSIALYQMAVFGGLAGGSWAFGMLAESHGVAIALTSAAGIALLSVFMGAVLRLPAISQSDLAPRTGWNVPETMVPVDGRSGPIVISIEHRIHAENVTAFLRIMNERRRVRRRDGARHWSLVRNLAEPVLWTERYEFSTWLAYVRQNQRVTLADQATNEALSALWLPGTSSVIHRWIERSTNVVPSLDYSEAREFDPVTDPIRSS